MSDKEVQEKIAMYLHSVNPEKSHIPWHELTSFVAQVFLDQAREILKKLSELGYCKLPKDKPPLSNRIWQRDVYTAHNTETEIFEAGKQAQREADIKWYAEG